MAAVLGLLSLPLLVGCTLIGYEPVADDLLGASEEGGNTSGGLVVSGGGTTELSGGGGAPGSGGMLTGGSATTGGVGTTGGDATGGVVSTGGDATGGVVSTGGVATGGVVSTGGVATGGVVGTGGTPVTFNSLRHRYDFAGTGLAVPDLVGSADATLFDDTAMSGLGYADLDGIDDYVAFPPNMLSGLQAFTVILWVVWDGAQCGQTLMSFGDNTGAPGEQGPLINTFAMQPESCVSGAGAVAVITSGSNNLVTDSVYKAESAKAGQLSQLAVTVDRSTGRWRFYLDGLAREYVLLVGYSDDRSLPALFDAWTDNKNWIGRDQDGSNRHFGGRVEELRIYDRAFASGEIQDTLDLGPDVHYDP